jgi:PleD family two-component response regulator
LELLEALRDEPRYAGIPVAVYTGHDEPAVRDAARRLGACDFIAKGQNWAATLEQITRCLSTVAPGT